MREFRGPGFSLVEVLIALVILEVGLLGAVGMTLQAQRTLQVALTLESVSQAVEGLADSLARGLASISGGQSIPMLSNAVADTLLFRVLRP